MEYQKHFSLEEAQALLIEVRPKLQEIVRLKDLLDKKGYDVHRHRYFGGMGPNGQKVFPDEMETLVEIVADLNQLGVVIKDLNSGLIDFPYRRLSGEEVMLCYRLPEEQIIAWHAQDAGFRGRRPLSEL